MAYGEEVWRSGGNENESVAYSEGAWRYGAIIWRKAASISIGGIYQHQHGVSAAWQWHGNRGSVNIMKWHQHQLAQHQRKAYQRNSSVK